jgi:hypothetical protein
MLLLNFSGCENRFENDQLPPGSDKLTVEQARLFLEKQRSDQISLKSGSLNSIGLKADWKNASLSSNEKVNVVETDILTLGGKFGFAMRESYDNYENFLQVGYLYSPTRLVIKKNKTTNEMVCFLMTIVGDKGYLEQKCFDLWNNNYLRIEKDFTGLVLFHNLEGQFVKGWRYSAGEICGMLNAAQNTDTGLRLKSTGGWNCEQETIYFMTFEDRYQTVYTNGVNPIESYSYTSVHTTEIVMSDCTYDPGTESGGGSTENPASDPYDYVPTSSPISVPIVNDTVLMKNTLTRCIYGKLLESSLLQNLVSAFVGSNQYHITYTIVDNILSANGEQAYGRCTDNEDGSMTVKINSYYFGKVAPVSIAKTILHESVHANIYQKVASVGGLNNLSTDNFDGLFAYYQNYGPKNYQHPYMAQYYVPELARALQSFDGNRYSLDYYEALSWAGLHETWEWQNMTQTQRDEIERKINEINAGTKRCD